MAASLFCESKWYGGTDTPEYMNAFSSLLLCAAGLAGFCTADVVLHPPFTPLCYGLIFTMGVGSFMHHWHSRQSAFWQRVDFYPMMWLTVLSCSILFMDVVRFVASRRARQLLTAVVMVFNCGYVMAGVSTDVSETQDVLFGTAWAFCYVWLALAWAVSARGGVAAAAAERAVAHDRASIQWTPAMKRDFRRAAALAFFPAVVGSAAWLLTEGSCTPANAARMGWVHSVVWHAGVAYSCWHLMQCNIMLTADWQRAKVDGLAWRGPCLVCQLSHGEEEEAVTA